jgi:hypothetical protein
LKAKQEREEEIPEDQQEFAAQELVQPEFNSKEVEEKFDTENPEIEIPPEVVVEHDNDWVLSEHEVEAHITQYNERKGQTISV